MVRNFWGLPTLLFLGLVTSISGVSAQDDFKVSNFKSRNLEGWNEQSFKAKTQYEFVESSIGTVLKAKSNASASALYREITIDLEKTPCLTWSWKVAGVLEGLDEKSKKGDDYPARVYVVFSGGLFFWRTQALNYVWSNKQPIGTSWPNAYTEQSINIAVQSGPGRVGQWVEQSRNIREDFKHLVGRDITQADGLALMTDTDNSGRSATAYYGDIRFTSSCSS